MTIPRWTAVAVALSINFVTVPGRLVGASNEYLKQAGLLFGAVCLLLMLSHVRLRLNFARWPLVTFLLFVAFCTLTLLWSLSVPDSLRYINKMWLAVALVALVLTVEPRDYPRLMTFLQSVMLAFLAVTVASELVLRDVLYPGRIGDNRLVGFSDIHSTKYLTSIAGIVFFARGLVTRRPRWMGLAAISFVVMALSLQRAIIGAAIGGTMVALGLFVVWKGRFRSVLVGFVLMTATALAGVYALFEYEPMRDRMFPTETHAVVAQELVLGGRFLEAYGQLSMRGREQFWSVAGEVEPGIGGLGFGMAGTLIEQSFGAYWQMHNDYLKLFVETGPVGVTLYVLFISTFLIAVTMGAARARTRFGAMFYIMAGGCFIIAPLNGLFDNALDHVQKNVLFGLCFLIMAGRWESEEASDDPGAAAVPESS